MRSGNKRVNDQNGGEHARRAASSHKEEAMIMIPVNSSAIRAVGYDGYTLSVEFHESGTYDHPGVPYDVYLGLMNASSMGRYYNRYIRGRYR